LEKKIIEIRPIALTRENFIFLHSILISLGYRKLLKSEWDSIYERLRPESDKKTKGKEVTYVYTNSITMLTVVLHTTYVEAWGEWRGNGEDIAWNLITEGDIAKYFAKPFKRPTDEKDVDKFIKDYLRYAWVSKWKVDHRPLCPCCSAYMIIYRKSNTRQYMWACFKNEAHPENDHGEREPQFLGWDHSLGPKAKDFVEIRREITKKYKERCKREGRNPRPAAKLRRGWKIRNRQNLMRVV
jgi:hypothetical protein